MTRDVLRRARSAPVAAFFFGILAFFSVAEKLPKKTRTDALFN
jgi:hypothetical protein